MSTARSDHPASFGYSSLTGGSARSVSPATSNSHSPVEPSGSSAALPPLGRNSYTSFPNGLNSSGIMAGNSRSGAGSPSHEMAGSSRLFSKRAREIQAQEGVPVLPLNPWGGPPTSGNSTPLRENIPESPTDGFPDFVQLPTPESLPQTRRARAGTVPSRFSPGGPINGPLGIPGLSAAKSARVTPAQSPFNKSPSPNLDHPDNAQSSSTLFSRLRAGSMPQRSQFAPLPGTSSPFGPSIFSSWNPTGVGRERGSTLASIASVGSNGPSSPAQSQFSKEGTGESDVHMRTLDYLGLAETPQPPRAQLATSYMPTMSHSRQPSRFRSYSVNNKDVYDDEDTYDDDIPIDNQYVAALQDQLAATNAAIHSHNLAVQAFVNQASVTRPRAQTAGALEIARRRSQRGLPGNTSLANSMMSADVHLSDGQDYDDLPQAVAGMSLGRSNSRNAGSGLLSADEQGLEGPTSALWLGSVPTSTTTSTLTEMFKAHGRVLSARVLTNKSCGFVNFERVESAISAKASLNGKEIFPGGGPIRINFAKPASASNTPGHDGLFPSPSPDPFSQGQDSAQTSAPNTSGDVATSSTVTNAAPTVPSLQEMTPDLLEIVVQFGATEEDSHTISDSLQSAIRFTTFIDEIPPIREPSHTRVHDAPKLRDIRKRIDNQSLSQAEIEGISVDMLPEIAELSSDYLGNTVVQKLFEHCSDHYRDAMLGEIAPHLAEIGVHKNGTWAAQKIIDVCKTPSQMSMIVEHLRPYTVPLFLDQYGNYVLQGCLKFGPPFNDFIFETMISRMWEVSQGRYGARAMRACLESHHASKNQQRLLAAAIATHSVQLATNANGALLLTWFLDTCTFSQRRSVLAPHLITSIVHLGTHKVAYLTVLKVINQKLEAEARDSLLRAIFFTPNDQVLEAILSDQTCGATFIFKVLTTPFFDETLRPPVTETIKNVLGKINAQPGQGYKRLMDEVGMSTKTSGANRDASTHSEQRQRPTSRQANMNGQHGNRAVYGAHHASNSVNYDAMYNAPRGDAADSNATPFPPFNQGMMFPGGNSMGPAMNMDQMQYQQNMMSRGGPPMGYSFPGMQAGYNGYGNAGASVDQLRQQNMANGSPIQPATHMAAMSGGQAGYGGFGMNMGGYGYGGGMGGPMPNMGYMQQDNGNHRRGRR